MQIWPSHGAGSACGKALGAIPTSTLGYEKMFNWAFRCNEESDFYIDFIDGTARASKVFFINEEFK